MSRCVTLMLILCGPLLAGANPPERFDVRGFGAVGDGIADDTAAIQGALEQAAKASPICFLPPGLYRINGSLTVPAGVTLCGASGGVPHSEHPVGSVLLAYGGRGAADGPAWPRMR